MVQVAQADRLAASRRRAQHGKRPSVTALSEVEHASKA